MKFTFKSIALICGLIWSASAGAQDFADGDTTSRANLQPVFKRSAGLHVGSQGIGLEVQHPLPYHLNVRAGVSTLPNLKATGVYSLSGYNTKVGANTASFWNAHLLLDVQPFNQKENFLHRLIVTAGAGYFPKAKATAVVMLDENYKYGDITFSPEEVGQLTTVSNWSGVAPYLGVGINNLVASNRFNMNLNLGTYYMTAPEVSISGTNMLEGNSENSAKMTENMKNYRWLPVLQLNFNYNL